LDALKITAIGRNWAKQRGVGLDAIFQLAMQLGYAVAASPPLPVSVYEACSTQGFAVGRTECIRSVTESSADVCSRLAPLVRSTCHEASNAAAANAILDCLSPADVTELASVVSKALDAHRSVVRNCQQGHGHERHLRALLDVAQTRGSTPALYTDAAWPTSCASYLSTSGLRNDHLALFSFGPVNPKGVGLAYLLEPNGIVLNVTSWHAAGPSAAHLSGAIDTASHVLKGIIERGAPQMPPHSKL